MTASEFKRKIEMYADVRRVHAVLTTAPGEVTVRLSIDMFGGTTQECADRVLADIATEVARFTPIGISVRYEVV